MKRLSLLVMVGMACTILGIFAGTEWAGAQAQQANYLVIEEFQLSPQMSVNEGTERLSRWVRALRETEKHSSVRLFLHDWGPEMSLYIVSETTSWDAVGDIFADIVAVEPDFMNEPIGFSGHSDNILIEIPIQ